MKPRVSDSNKAFCILPWIHFHVGLHGRVQPCCIASKPMGDINKESLEEIWNGEKFRELRTKMLAGKKVKACKGCYSLEENGVESLRQENNKKFVQHIDLVQNTDSDGSISSHPVYWDIRFSNVCNFKCRTCWHGASSKWFEEAKKNGNTAADQAIIKNIEDINGFFKDNRELLIQADEFYFAGGEPLIMEEHYKLLDLLTNTGAQPTLRYNTNLSSLSFKERKVTDLWDHFDDVEVMISIDGIGQHGESIRTGQNFQKLEENLQYLINNTAVRVFISPTISSLNVGQLPEIYDWWLNAGGKDEGWYINILQRPKEFNIKYIPESEKAFLIKELKKSQSQYYNSKYAKGLSEILKIID
ncbi:twitch domain-containing radical SAM protein [Mangrovivirga sp. M17]|uniref:Twitch domain-containing radical SAM protein n=1 Tax=Mangrovivirga halotolerans TaxID=2993936 RepID=A0ABT3RTS5_9BACT|nr:twitch domain-containing radical SAM protein [Mangrovivirga halotolerans]MCX2744652.1 twitch domain-containing radical SAM protein [Mangrovivirga halotolerans]